METTNRQTDGRTDGQTDGRTLPIRPIANAVDNYLIYPILTVTPA